MTPVGRMPAAITIREVGPRDGLQNEDPIPTDAKVALINALSRTGVSRIEAVSFVHPAAIPQMADADAVWSRIRREPSVRYSALVPNLRGAARALAAGFTEIEVVVSASDTHNRRNINRTTDESLAELSEIVASVHDGDGTLEVIVSTAWGCPYEGDVPVERVIEVAKAAVDAGADSLTYGDTTGMATPVRVVELVERTRDTFGDLPLALHLHNTRGTGLANLYAALQLGVTNFDASVGGLGGCPYAPGATGNIATEEVVAMVEDMGIATGIDIEALLDAASFAQLAVGKELPSNVLRAGPRNRLTPLDAVSR
ncbi:MAG TPA: hydroxymethylglutaryl-CoA lyase [Jatrophihabitantaceae bacterium]